MLRAESAFALHTPFGHFLIRGKRPRSPADSGRTILAAGRTAEQKNCGRPSCSHCSRISEISLRMPRSISSPLDRAHCSSEPDNAVSWILFLLAIQSSSSHMPDQKLPSDSRGRRHTLAAPRTADRAPGSMLPRSRIPYPSASNHGRPRAWLPYRAWRDVLQEEFPDINVLRTHLLTDAALIAGRDQAGRPGAVTGKSSRMDRDIALPRRSGGVSSRTGASDRRTSCRHRRHRAHSAPLPRRPPFLYKPIHRQERTAGASRRRSVPRQSFVPSDSFG